MQKKIAIFGSTGSIGRTLLNIISSNKKKYKVVLLSANDNYNSLIKQAKKHKVKNLILTNKKNSLINEQNKSNQFRIYNDFKCLKHILNKKIDYIMCANTGVEGLIPTLLSIRHTRKIAIANKESIICGWNLINKELKKFDTKFVPVDYNIFLFGME